MDKVVTIGATRCYNESEWFREITVDGVTFLAPLDQQDAAKDLLGSAASYDTLRQQLAATIADRDILQNNLEAMESCDAKLREYIEQIEADRDKAIAERDRAVGLLRRVKEDGNLYLLPEIEAAIAAGGEETR